MKSRLHIAALIMAAGASTRMEGIKQLLQWKTSNLLLETIKTLKASNVASVHVVLGANAEKIITECALEEQEVEWMVNSDWPLGLGKSIAFGVKSLLHGKPLPDGILICLADQPLISAAYLNTVIKTFEMEGDKIVATDYGNRAGVPAVFPTWVYPDLALLVGDQGARNILEHTHHSVILLNAKGQLADIDTKRAYLRLKNNK